MSSTRKNRGVFISQLSMIGENKKFEIDISECMLKFLFDISSRLIEVIYKQNANKINNDIYTIWKFIFYLEDIINILYRSFNDILDELKDMLGIKHEDQQIEIQYEIVPTQYDLKKLEKHPIVLFSNIQDNDEFKNSLIHIYGELNEIYQIVYNTDYLLKNNEYNICILADELLSKLLHISIHIDLMIELNCEKHINE